MRHQADIQNFKTNTSSGDVENKWSVLVHLIETTLSAGEHPLGAFKLDLSDTVDLHNSELIPGFEW